MRRQLTYDKSANASNQAEFLSLSFFDLSKVVWTACEPRQFDSKTPLSVFLEKLLREHGLTIREACCIAGCSPSVLHGWLHGAYPTDTVIHLKKLCNQYGYSLAEALTGSPDQISEKKAF